MKQLVATRVLLTFWGCIDPTSTDCSRGAWLGGAAGTSRCLPDHAYQPRYLPEQEIAPYLDAVQRDVERRTREIERERRRTNPR